MSSDNLNAAPAGLNLDADAVCAQCGTVNPEGTLICKVCGNNLRDQRTMRLSAEQVLESVGEPPASRAWLRGVLFAVGALLVLLMAVFANNFATYLVSGGLEASGIDALWAGEQHQVFDGLRSEIKAANTDAEAIAAAIAAAAPIPDGAEAPALDGLYVLLPPGAESDATPYGTAAVKLEGDEVAFAAVLQDGLEVRGWATQRSTGLLTADAERAALLEGREHVPVYGYIQRDADGYFNGYCQRADAESEQLVPFVAYKLGGEAPAAAAEAPAEAPAEKPADAPAEEPAAQ